MALRQCVPGRASAGLAYLRHDLHQCVIFDSNAPGARLIGIEYFISEERFRALPDDEKRLWHSHHYEVKSGILVAPGIPDLAEHAYFEDLVSTYEEPFHTWQYDRDDFPYGIPQLMMGLTGDGQADEERFAPAAARLASPPRVRGAAAPTSRGRRSSPAPTPGRAAGPCRPGCRSRTSGRRDRRQPGTR